MNGLTDHEREFLQVVARHDDYFPTECERSRFFPTLARALEIRGLVHRSGLVWGEYWQITSMGRLILAAVTREGAAS